jgi:hypothetical protein
MYSDYTWKYSKCGICTLIILGNRAKRVANQSSNWPYNKQKNVSDIDVGMAIFQSLETKNIYSTKICFWKYKKMQVAQSLAPKL